MRDLSKPRTGAMLWALGLWLVSDVLWLFADADPLSVELRSAATYQVFGVPLAICLFPSCSGDELDESPAFFRA